VQYLPRAYDYWFTHFVDKEFGEVWNSVDGRTHAPVRQAPKQWEWKNAYHSFEHALVGYIVGQQLNDQPITLYKARQRPTPRKRSYSVSPAVPFRGHFPFTLSPPSQFS
jgi:hypothetical protein